MSNLRVLGSENVRPNFDISFSTTMAGSPTPEGSGDESNRLEFLMEEVS